MSSVIAPKKNITFTVTSVPKRDAQIKTIQRLMRMQVHIQQGLRHLAIRRRQVDNVTTIRAGRPWTNRKKVTKLTPVQQGETFTLLITPQIIPDIKSVEKFLAAKTAK